MVGGWEFGVSKLFAKFAKRFLLMLTDAILSLYCGYSGGKFLCTFTLCLYKATCCRNEHFFLLCFNSC